MPPRTPARKPTVPQRRTPGTRGHAHKKRTALGVYGEDLAVEHLREAGLEILDRNWRCQRGELDIVARVERTLVICEVKTRSGVEFGSPFEAVTRAKVSRLRRLALCWLAEHEATHFTNLRFDVVGVLCAAGGRVCVEHVAGVG